jgi:NADP-dependent aldehyde dehydrogenase
MIFGDLVGASLVQAPEIKAVGFTGSLAGGRALCQLAAQRPEPIPVFAEMSSVNPVILLPRALAERSGKIARDLAESVTLGAGQFCTNPGLILGIRGEAFAGFCAQFSEGMRAMAPGLMLGGGYLRNYRAGIGRLEQTPGVEILAAGAPGTDRAQARLFQATAGLLADPGHPLEEEVFGPCATLVELASYRELLAMAAGLKGHLTASLFAEEEELGECRDLLDLLEGRVGRVIVNQVPTGVEVGEAIFHGGPYPATSDSRNSSVGTQAVERFLRPVCYQNAPDSLLPEALQNANPLGLRRLVDGCWTTGSLEERVPA